jgi:hypothetical protein
MIRVGKLIKDGKPFDSMAVLELLRNERKYRRLEIPHLSLWPKPLDYMKCR